MKPVATDAVSLCDSTIQRVDGRRRWQAEEERGVENRHLRHIREQAPRHLDTLYPGRIVQRRQGRQLGNLRDHRVVKHRRFVKLLTPVHHAVTDYHHITGIDGVEDQPQRLFVVADLLLADALHQSVSNHSARFRLDELIFDRGRAAVEDQNRPAGAHDCFLSCAWIAVMATVLTMSSTNAPRERSLMGLRSPCRTGPMAMAPALRCTAL
ncbi:Uncharacterised protein [Mycobacteroides abscessus subsp. abscessus]|nr:Uncharacterised protein [Mycobacteroides abscessus subsp. abscessus]